MKLTTIGLLIIFAGAVAVKREFERVQEVAE